VSSSTPPRNPRNHERHLHRRDRDARRASPFGYITRKHLDEETLGFAADINRKLLARQSNG
jgi:hypothetical protein